MRVLQDITKKLFDIAFSILGILITSPILLLISLAIIIDSKGSIIFKQYRLGKYGKEFYMFKFRSMVENAETMGTGLFNYEDDPRVTRVGQFLRKTSLDELPQLFNILKGEMSFVGPRPPVTYELGNYNEFSDKLKKRFIVKPGVTGFAQIAGRNELSWDEKIKFDIEYIKKYQKWGILIDIKIILLTIVKVLRMEGSYELMENARKDADRIDNSAKK
jgi:lipopolysaccharide/colanic/teichoic acid biosynthesis glycosyltransferase